MHKQQISEFIMRNVWQSEKFLIIQFEFANVIRKLKSL